MKPLLVDPKRVIPWHPPRFPLKIKRLVQAAQEEKCMRENNPRSLEEELDRIKRYFNSHHIHYPAHNAPGWQGIPPVPLLKAPPDLADLGDYVVYEGHHRTVAAVQADIFLPAGLVTNDEDIDFLIKKRVANQGNCGRSFIRHGDLVYHMARMYLGR